MYGNIYHNLATAYVQLFLFDIAADLYLEAFRQNGDRKSLWSCLYAYKLDNNDIGYARIVREYSVTEQEINNLDNALKGRICRSFRWFAMRADQRNNFEIQRGLQGTCYLNAKKTDDTQLHIERYTG